MTELNKIRTRLAPSPTGDIHIGSLRQALFCYAYAKQNNGEYIVRIEDTDRKRFVKGSIKGAFEIFEKYNLQPDITANKEQIEKSEDDRHEGVYYEDWLLHQKELENVEDSEYDDIYIQSLRVPLYQKYALKLLKDGTAYCCFCTQERLDTLREEQQSRKEHPKYDGLCKSHSFEESLERIKKGAKYTIRMNVAAYQKKHGEDIIPYKDGLMGKANFPIKEVDDQVIVKSDGIPTYHLAVVVDDHLMKITHPMRGAEWISSTPKQIILYDMLGWEMPKFYHLPVIEDPEGGKLSKRKGSVAAKDFLKQGYLHDAVLNFLMLLGWAPSDNQELFNVDEFIQKFSLDRLNKSNPVFNRQKLLWFNTEYIKKLDNSILLHKVKPFLIKNLKEVGIENTEISDGLIKNIIEIEKTRLELLTEIGRQTVFYFKDNLTYDSSILMYKTFSKDEIIDALEKAMNLIERLEETQLRDLESLKKYFLNESKNYNKDRGLMLSPMRIALTGEERSPSPFEALWLIGKNRSIERIRDAILKLKEE